MASDSELVLSAPRKRRLQKRAPSAGSDSQDLTTSTDMPDAGNTSSEWFSDTTSTSASEGTDGGDATTSTSSSSDDYSAETSGTSSGSDGTTSSATSTDEYGTCDWNDEIVCNSNADCCSCQVELTNGTVVRRACELQMLFEQPPQSEPHRRRHVPTRTEAIEAADAALLRLVAGPQASAGTPDSDCGRSYTEQDCAHVGAAPSRAWMALARAARSDGTAHDACCAWRAFRANWDDDADLLGDSSISDSQHTVGCLAFEAGDDSDANDWVVGVRRHRDGESGALLVHVLPLARGTPYNRHSRTEFGMVPRSELRAATDECGDGGYLLRDGAELDAAIFGFPHLTEARARRRVANTHFIGTQHAFRWPGYANTLLSEEFEPARRGFTVSTLSTHRTALVLRRTRDGCLFRATAHVPDCLGRTHHTLGALVPDDSELGWRWPAEGVPLGPPSDGVAAHCRGGTRAGEPCERPEHCAFDECLVAQGTCAVRDSVECTETDECPHGTCTHAVAYPRFDDDSDVDWWRHPVAKLVAPPLPARHYLD